MKKYKFSALFGTLIMGISSFMSCLSESSLYTNIGNTGLILSIGIMSYGFSKWQP